MSEMHIRINKRTFERVLFSLVIIGLLLVIFLQPPGAVNEEEVASLQEQVTSLTQQTTALEEELASTKEELAQAQEANIQSEPETTTPEPEPEPELSGELTFEYDWSTTGGSLNAFIVEIDNGLDRNRELTVRVNWQGGDLEQVVRTNNVFVRSGEQETIIIDDLPSNPGSSIDSLRVVIRDELGTVESDIIRVL